MAITIVDFKNEFFDDFKALILPNIYDEMISSDVMKEDGLFCIGALDEEKPVGALIASLSDVKELDIASIYVDPKYRDKGIGKRLVHYAIEAALQLSEASSPINDPTVQILITTEYSLEQSDFARFRKFLSKNKFTIHEDFPNQLYITKDDFEKLKEKNLKCTAPAKINMDNYLEMATDIGINLDDELCFCIGNEENPKAVMLTGFGYDNMFAVSLMNEACTKEELCGLLISCLGKTFEKYSDGPVIMNMNNNIAQLEELLRGCALVCMHSVSSGALLFPAKGDK